MHCTRCKTDFCYKCGDKLRRLKFFGDHYSKLSIFGCKYRYKADQPLQRKLIRGAVFASKVMLVPILGSLAVCAGAVVVVLGVAALPLYAAIKIYRKYRSKKHLKSIRGQTVISTISNSVNNLEWFRFLSSNLIILSQMSTNNLFINLFFLITQHFI